MKHDLNIGDKVAYKMLDLEKDGYYEKRGIIRSFDPNGTQVVIFFDKEQKEYICQIDQTRKIFIIGDKVCMTHDTNIPPKGGVIIDLNYKPNTLVPDVAKVKWEKPIVNGESTGWTMISFLRHFNKN